MSGVTFGYAGEWDRWLGRGVRRQTVIVGRMRATGSLKFHTSESPTITTCEHCGGLRYDLGGPHAVQVSPAGRFDCRGRALA